MTLAAYSTSLNVNPSVAAGNGLKGQAVCNPGSGFVVATTANRAAGTVDLGGVALEDFNTGGQFRIVSSGYVPADIVGTLSGSGRWVNVDASGSLYKSASTSSDTIGLALSDGAVVVDLRLQAGSISNATSIQGVTVSGASANRAQILAGDNTALRARPDNMKSILDWVPHGTDPASITDWRSVFYDFLNDPNVKDGMCCYLPIVAGAATPYPITGKLRLYTDDERGGKKKIVFWMENGQALGSAANAITCNFSNISGNAASITFVGTGTGSFQLMRLTGCTGATLALASELEGETVKVAGGTNASNTCLGVLCKVEADGVIWVSNPAAGAGVDLSGTVTWEIQRVGVDFAIYAGWLQNFAVQPGAGKQIHTLLHIGEAWGANAPATASMGGDNIFLSSTAPNTARFTEGMAFAKTYVPWSTSPHYTTGVYSGVTVPQPYLPNGISEGVWGKVHVENCPRGVAVAGYSGSGQAEQHTIMQLSANFVQCMFDNPHTFSSTTPFYKAHVNLLDVRVGTVYDTIVSASNAARPMNIWLISGESGAGCRIYEGKDGSTVLPLRIRDVYLSYYGTYKEHPTGELMSIASPGPVTVDGLFVATLNDSSGWTIRCTSNTRYHFPSIGFSGKTLRAGRPAQLLASTRGPRSIPDGSVLEIETAPGVPQTLTISKAAVEASCAARFGTYTCDSNRYTDAELAAWITDHLTNGKAYGRWDSSELRLMSTTSWLKVNVPGAGTDINAKLGFPTGAVAPTAQTQLSKDTGGWLEMGSGVTDCSVTFTPSARTYGGGTPADYPLDSFVNRHYGTTYKKLGNAYPLYLEVTQAGGAGTTVTATFASLSVPLNDQQDTNYKVRITPVSKTAAAAAGSILRDGTLTKNQGFVSFGIQADPGGAESAVWGVEIIR